MKYHIEKNTVQETLIIPLYGRKKCTEKFPQLFKDETAVRLIKQIDYDFSEVEKKGDSTMQEFGFLEIAIRQNDLAYEVKKYLKSHPNAAVVNLGCGLDNTGRNCDNDSCRIYNIDFPDVIEVRNSLLPAGEREKNIAADLKDTSWFNEIQADGGVIFFASGVFYYFLTEDVKALFLAMAEHFAQWHLEDMDKISKDKDVVLLDVRTVGEFSRGHIDGFKNIPVDELRERISEIEKGKPVYLICQSGLRSYIASRILEGNGYETYNFSGGFRFYDAVVNDRALIERAYACGMDY